MRYAQNLGLLDAMTLGAETPEQMRESIGLDGPVPGGGLVRRCGAI